MPVQREESADAEVSKDEVSSQVSKEVVTSQVTKETPLVTTTQVFHVARKLAGHHWSTSDIAKTLGVKEYQVRSAVFWLVSQSLVRHAGTEYRDLPAPYTGRKYDVKTYTVTDTGMSHEYVSGSRDIENEHFGDVRALEMAFSFWGRKQEGG